MAMMALPANAPTALKILTRMVDDMWYYAGDRSTYVSIVTFVQMSRLAFSALMLLVQWQEGHLACKNICFKTPGNVVMVVKESA